MGFVADPAQQNVVKGFFKCLPSTLFSAFLSQTDGG